MQLYSYYRSTASYRVRIALHIKGIDYDYMPIHPVRNGGDNNTPEFRKLNPQAQVPVLVDGDTVLTQSLSILEYLDEKYPQQKIMPETAESRAFVRQIAQVIAVDTHPLLTLRVLNHLSGEMGVQKSQKTEWYKKWVHQGLDAVEKLLERSPFRTGPYCCGDSVTLADICLVPAAYDAHRHDISLAAWPLIAEIEKKCLTQKTFQDAGPENQPDTPEDQRLNFLRGRA